MDIVQLLVESGADVEAVDDVCEFVQELACFPCGAFLFFLGWSVAE